MSGIKPKARENDAGRDQAAGRASSRGEQGIVLDEQGQEQPNDKSRAQQDDQVNDDKGV